MKYSVASCSHGVPYGEPCDDCGPVVVPKVPKPAKGSGKTDEPMLSHCALCEDPNFLYRDCVVAAINDARKDARAAAFRDAVTWAKKVETVKRNAARDAAADNEFAAMRLVHEADGAKRVIETLEAAANTKEGD